MSRNYEDFKKKKILPKVSEVKWVCKKPPEDYNMPLSWSKGNKAKSDDPNLYTYKNANGEVCFYIHRVDKDFGKKDIIPYSYFEREDTGESKWQPKAWEKDRPLYNEEKIKTAYGKKIAICEGEKTTKAINDNPDLNEKYLAVTWSGGSNSAWKTKFQALKDKEIVLFPDNDQSGYEAMHYVAKTCIEQGITDQISWADYDSTKVSEGWDAADPLPKNETWDNFFKLLEYVEDDKVWKKLDQLEAERETKAALQDLMEQYVYIRSLNAFFDKKTFEIIDEKQLNSWYRHITKKGPGIATLLLQQKEFTKVLSFFTHPGLKSGVISINDNQVNNLPQGIYLNNFRPNNIEASPGDRVTMQMVDDYYTWLLGSNAWDIIKQFIAYLIQQPGVKIMWVVVLISNEGVGKQLLMMLISAALGKHNVKENVSVDQLTSKHSTIIEGTQLVCLNELSLTGYQKDKTEIGNKLKALFTDRSHIIDRKNKPIVEIPNLCNFFVASNDERCLKLGTSSRRYYIKKIKRTPEEVEEMLEDKGYKNKILDAIEDPGQVLHFFKNVEIKDKKIFHRSAPKTDDLAEMIQDSKPELHKYLDLMLEDNKYPFWGDNVILTTKQLYDWFIDWKTKPVKVISLGLVEDWLKQNCIPWLNGEKTKQIFIYASRPRYYLIKNSGKIDLRTMSEKDIATWFMNRGKDKRDDPIQFTQQSAHEPGFTEKSMPPIKEDRPHFVDEEKAPFE